MPRKKKHGIRDELFRDSIFEEIGSLFEKSPETGYSISVVQTPEGTKVKAKVGKNIDTTVVRKQLELKYPKAAIEIEGGSTEPLIQEISTKTIKEENQG